MEADVSLEPKVFESPGRRLSHILDVLGFHTGRGRVKAFHKFLSESDSGFEELKYPAVRSWFQDSSPPINKMELIVDVLISHYSLDLDAKLVVNWWKLGGLYPFKDSRHLPAADLTKSEFLLMSVITDVVGRDFDAMTSEQLVVIKKRALRFMELFSDPRVTDCPKDFLIAIVKNEVEQSRKSNLSGEIDEIFMSQIVLEIEKQRKESGRFISDQNYSALTHRVGAFCKKNGLKPSDANVQKYILRLLDLERDNLL